MAATADRYLKDKSFDRIDHALGRPVDPMAETYRDYFAVNAGSSMVAAFDASPHWRRGDDGGGVVFFHVTDEGRKALAVHLKTVGDPWRAYEVTFKGFTDLVTGKSHGDAKYSHFLDVSDCDPDLTFGEYLKGARVRLASPERAAA